MSLSTIREQVRAEVRGEQAKTQDSENLTNAERAALRAMRRRFVKTNTDGAKRGTFGWWV